MDSTHGRAGELTLEEVERLLTPEGEVLLPRVLVKDGVYRTTIHIGFEPFDVVFYVKPSLGMYLVTHRVVQRHAPQIPQGESESEDPSGTKAKAVHAAVDDLWPQGHPGTLSRKDAKRLIRAWITERPNEYSAVSDRTIDRELDALR